MGELHIRVEGVVWVEIYSRVEGVVWVELAQSFVITCTLIISLRIVTVRIIILDSDVILM